MEKKMKMEMENLGDLRREGTGGGELFANEIAGGDVRDTEEVREARGVADEIAGGDVRDTEEVREARGVGAFSDAGAAKENPLDRAVVMAEREGLSVKDLTQLSALDQDLVAWQP
uniref:Uncharacterized protein n=1 Tax=Fagus sylvatica TaxID=28930 RepID=A0A2N9INW8_FAGSY